MSGGSVATRLAGPTTMVVERCLYSEKQYAVGGAGERMKLSSRSRSGWWMKRWMARLAMRFGDAMRMRLILMKSKDGRQ